MNGMALRFWFLLAVGTLLVCFDDAANAATTSPAFPVTVNSNKRYLVDHAGNPFIMVADAPWMLPLLNPTDLATYLNDRQAKGVNALVVDIPYHDLSVNSGSMANYNGDLPFTGVAFASPLNPAYWTYVDTIVAQAAARGMLLIFFPAYLGYAGDGSQGVYLMMEAAGNANLAMYGTAIGTRYKNSANILWCVGGDYNPVDMTSSVAVVTAMRAAGATQIWTSHASMGTTGRTEWPPSSYPWAVIDSIYDWPDSATPFAWSQINADYLLTNPTMPILMVEGEYEHNPDGTTNQQVRQEMYEPVLSGSLTGYVYGNDNLWRFAPGWQAELNSQGGQDLARSSAFFRSRTWWKLVPDDVPGGVAGTFITSNNGWSNSWSWISGAVASDGSWGAAYFPAFSAATFALKNFAAPVHIYWWDPTSGSIKNVVLSQPNSGSLTVSTSPGANSAGSTDWLLVFETSQGTPVPAFPAKGRPLAIAATALTCVLAKLRQCRRARHGSGPTTGTRTARWRSSGLEPH
jgi:hypothetical protein